MAGGYLMIYADFCQNVGTASLRAVNGFENDTNNPIHLQNLLQNLASKYRDAFETPPAYD